MDITWIDLVLIWIVLALVVGFLLGIFIKGGK